jgi:GNAT superfamily N-acetyltransferase
MDITITRANISHAALIATIGKKSFREAFGHLFHNREELFEYLEREYDPVRLAKSLRKGSNIFFLAFKNGQAIGFAKVKLDSLNEHIESVAQMELQKIYVLPGHRGSGAGTALLDEVKQLAHDINPDYVWLDTCAGSEKAIQFCERNGFEKIGKYFFTIGTQTFEYHVMGLPVAINIRTAC